MRPLPAPVGRVASHAREARWMQQVRRSHPLYECTCPVYFLRFSVSVSRVVLTTLLHVSDECIRCSSTRIRYLRMRIDGTSSLYFLFVFRVNLNPIPPLLHARCPRLLPKADARVRYAHPIRVAVLIIRLS